MGRLTKRRQEEPDHRSHGHTPENNSLENGTRLLQVGLRIVRSGDGGKWLRDGSTWRRNLFQNRRNVPIMVAMMLIATNKSVMRAFRLGPIVAIAGCASTALMAIAATVLIWSWLA